MSSINKVIIIGRLGKDPETRYTTGGDAICNATVATSESWKDKNSGEKKEATKWHRIVFYRKLAEIAGQYLKKGSAVYIEGKLKTRKWQDKDGQDHFTTEIEATEMLMLGGKQDSDDAPRSASAAPASKPPQSRPAPGGGNFGDMDDDIPF